jgi:hypothetical protein
MSNLRARLGFINNIHQHLTELRCLLGSTVAASDLLSLEETEAIRESWKRTERSPRWRCEVGFEARIGTRFSKLIERFSECQPQVYLWTNLSNSCGLARPVALLEVQFGFEFGAIAAGIITVISVDSQDRLLLDFSECDGELMLEIEVEGACWGRIQY